MSSSNNRKFKNIWDFIDYNINCIRPDIPLFELNLNWWTTADKYQDGYRLTYNVSIGNFIVSTRYLICFTGNGPDNIKMICYDDSAGWFDNEVEITFEKLTGILTQYVEQKRTSI